MSDDVDLPRLRRIKRRAERAGLRISKIAERSRWYWQYGPYQIIDIYTNSVCQYGIQDLDELEAALADYEVPRPINALVVGNPAGG